MKPRPQPDRLAAIATEAKQSDITKGTGPRKPYASASPDVAPDLHSALTSVGDQMLKYHDKPASLATVGHALKSVAGLIKPEASDIGQSVGPPEAATVPEIGKDTSGLFGTPEEAV
jgi:hypothetical protein